MCLSEKKNRKERDSLCQIVNAAQIDAYYTGDSLKIFLINIQF